MKFVKYSLKIFSYNKHERDKKIIYNNGEVYEGEFLNGKRHGFGKFTFESGVIIEGIWINGKFSIKYSYKLKKKYRKY